MAYCDEEDGHGLGALPVRAYLVNRTAASPLTDPRFQALRRAAQANGATAPAPVVHPKGEVAPPPPAPTIDYDALKRKYPCGTRTDPYAPCPEPATPTAPTPTTSGGGGGGGPTFAPAIVPAPSFAPGGGGPVTVTVESADAAAAPKGFGMVEAAIAAGLAVLVGAVFARKGRR